MGRLIASGRALAMVVAVGLGGMAEAAEPGTVTVTYRPPLISLDARDAPLGAVLGEVGAKAGFTVVEAAGEGRRVTISIQEATLDDVLRQLLRSENHTLLYRAEPGHPGGVPDQVVLLGPATAGPAVAATAPGPAAHPAAGPAPGAVPPVAGGPRPDPPPALEPDSTASEDVEPTVSDVLRSHATATLRAAEAARAAPADPGPAAGPAPASPGGPGPPNVQLSPEAQDALSAATRRAQQSLKALVEGLDAATQSLQPPAPGARQPAPRR